MLQFISGRASSGKSYEICRRIAECVKNGKEPVLIIPEQFSFESEKRILELLGDSGAQKVKVLSFSRLCDEVENITGGGALAQISDSDRIILMNTALRGVRDKLTYFGKYAVSPGFTKLILATVDEFLMNGVSLADIKEAANAMGDGVLKRKLLDTALIFAEYNDLVFDKFSNSTDRLTRLYDMLGEYDYFAGKQVFIDSFSGFTGQQYRIIDRILSSAENTVVSLCDGTENTRRLDIFANIRKAKARIRALAERHGVKCADDTVLKSGGFVPKGLSALEEFMCLGKTEGEISDCVTVCRAATAYDEAQFVARNIRRIVRQDKARLEDFVVIARNADDYEQVLYTAFGKNKIRCFSDRRMPLISFPPASVVLAAMELSGKMTTEKLLRFHKSGVSFLSEEELFELENYAYIWNIDGDTWNNRWNMDPHGLDNPDADRAELKAEIEHINDLRVKALAPVLRFKKDFCGDTKSMARACVALLESAKQEFINISENYKGGENPELSQGIVTAYSKIMNILDSIVNCLDYNASAREFKEAFKNCVNIESVGVIPQMIDEVIFGSAERIQPSRPSYVFIMGANQGVFPRAPQPGGVFAVSEIGKLIEHGIDIPDCSVYSAIDEDFLVYNCVCCADRRVFISFNSRSGEMSHFLKKLVERFGLAVQNEPDILGSGNLPETADDAFARFCRSEYGGADYMTLKSVLEENPDYSARINSLSGNVARPRFRIPEELSSKLIGNKISLSPTRFETFSKCPFRYFGRYALSVKSAQPVSFNTMQSGTLVHYVLEKFVKEAGSKISEPGAIDTDAAVERLVNEYLDLFEGYREAQTPHLELMVRQMTETLKYLAGRLVSEFSQSDFKPEKCEFVIGNGGDTEPIVLDVDGKTSVVVTGKIDRIDKYGDYVRVIDYKTGSRSFVLPDILMGQNMQMLIYLYAVCRHLEQPGIPAGIFYMHAALADENTPKSRRMSGFMPEDEMLIQAMDKSGQGEYIPLGAPRTPRQGTTKEDFSKIFDFIDLKLKQAGRQIAGGCFDADPIDGRESGSNGCKYCDFASICRIEDEKHKRAPNFKRDEVMAEIERQVAENGV